jgi:hypothetical protein
MSVPVAVVGRAAVVPDDEQTRSDFYRRSLRASRLRLPFRHHLPLRTLPALRPCIDGAAGGDRARRQQYSAEP